MQVLDHLAGDGFDEVAEFTTAQETLTFSLPNEIRRDLKAAGKSDKMRHDARRRRVRRAALSDRGGAVSGAVR